jgi:dTMP kinase
MAESSRPRGIFITLEGPDGAGKSSQARLLADRIRAAGGDVVLTREPGGTKLGERIRAILLDASAESHDSLSDALLFNAARSRQVSEVIRPALEHGAIVVCDRFSDSTLAYQGYGGGVPLDALKHLAAVAIGITLPERTVLIDLSVQAGLARRNAGSSEGLNRFETDASKHDAAFHERVRSGYLELANQEPERWRVVDGSLEREAVANAVWSAVADLLPERIAAS